MALVGNISGSSSYNSNIGISGSVVIANRPDALFPTLNSVGGDVVFFVSGSRGGKGSIAERTVSVFGGDAVVSGSLTIGTGSVTITSNDITFQSALGGTGLAQIFSGSGGLTFKDAAGTATLASLIAGSAVTPSYWSSITPNEIFTTGSAVVSGSIISKEAAGKTVFEFNPVTSLLTTVSGTFTGDVTVQGDLTINGTTTTVNTQNLLVEDPVIYFGSGSIGSNRDGGIALASGSSVPNQALVWGRVAQDTWGAGRYDVKNGIETNLTPMSLVPIRASKFEVGSSTAFISSSNGIELALDAGTGPINIGSSNSNRTVNIGTGAAVQAITVGSQNSSSALTLQAGLGNVSITGAPGTAYTIGATGTVGAITVGQSTDDNTIAIGNANTANTKTQTINIGAGTPSGTGKAVITIGNSLGASAVNIAAGTGNVSIIGGGGTNYTVGSTSGTGTITVGQSTASNTISIGAGAYADGSTQNINIGNGTLAGTTGKSVVTIGNNNAATAVNIVAGTGNVSIGGAVGTTYTVGTATGTGTITLGRSTDTNTISIGNANTADTKIQNINIGAGSPAATGKAVITIGNTNGASKIDLKAGTDNIVAWSNLVPNTDRGFDLGSQTARWNNIYTGDLHLRNERGDYTLIEEEDFLTIRFNKTGKRYKFLLEPVPELDEK